MPNIETEFTESPRKDMHIFFVLDTSGSMSGDKIDALNTAMEETVQVLSEEAANHGDAKLKIAVMEYNTGCKWVTPNGAEDLDGTFIWDRLTAGGLTSMGDALEELNSKLSRNGFLNSMTGALMPVIVFMTDGYPTQDYLKALEKIRQNKWFQRCVKIGFALGDDADVGMIASIVGNSEAVIKTSDLTLFRTLLRFASVTASMLASKSSTTTTTVTGADVVEQAKKQLGLDDSITPPENTKYIPEPDPDPDPVNPWGDGTW